jgi:hypothetical protein
MQVGFTLLSVQGCTSVSALASTWDSILAVAGVVGADGDGNPVGVAATSLSITTSFTVTISTQAVAAA